METAVTESMDVWAVALPAITAVAGIVIGFGWGWIKKAVKASENTIDDTILAAIEKAVKDGSAK